MDGYDNYGAQSPVDKSRADPHDRDTYAPRERDPYRDSRRRSPGESWLQLFGSMCLMHTLEHVHSRRHLLLTCLL